MGRSTRGDGSRNRDTFAVERREQILRIVNEHGRVRTGELAERLEVSEPTIRKDIADLESQGLLTRAHGGAVARGSMAEVDVTTRETKFLDEKQAIARACVTLIRDGDSVFLDGGTTQHELARLLAADRRQVKILTNSFKVGEICEGMSEPPVVLGGRYRSRGGCFVGPLTMATLRQFRLDLSFVGVTGVTETGFCAADLSEAEIKTEAVARAGRAVVPLDHSKIGLGDFITVCPLGAVDTVVTDRKDAGLGQWLESAGVEMVVTDPSGWSTTSSAPPPDQRRGGISDATLRPAEGRHAPSGIRPV